eukprot:TRINITY_DN200_c0_g1_i1.p1 TRINITY_DN200_c0_g1~~TRINITY_DN200_c0_g1_i1.p1  ORF type:complete len:165 (+),score=23.94 TRINITY_DN200_c0_g1_i1:288-782(+)
MATSSKLLVIWLKMGGWVNLLFSLTFLIQFYINSFFWYRAFLAAVAFVAGNISLLTSRSKKVHYAIVNYYAQMFFLVVSFTTSVVVVVMSEPIAESFCYWHHITDADCSPTHESVMYMSMGTAVALIVLQGPNIYFSERYLRAVESEASYSFNEPPAILPLLDE